MPETQAGPSGVLQVVAPRPIVEQAKQIIDYAVANFSELAGKDALVDDKDLDRLKLSISSLPESEASGNGNSPSSPHGYSEKEKLYLARRILKDLNSEIGDVTLSAGDLVSFDTRIEREDLVAIQGNLASKLAGSDDKISFGVRAPSWLGVRFFRASLDESCWQIVSALPPAMDRYTHTFGIPKVPAVK